MKPQIFFSLVALLTGPSFPVQAAEKEAKPSPPEVPPAAASAAEVPAGFRAEVLMSDLTYPSSIESDARGNLYVAEAGYSYGDDSATPRILRISQSGEIAAFASRGLHGPPREHIIYRPSLLTFALIGALIGGAAFGWLAYAVAEGSLPIEGLGQFAAGGWGVATFTGAGVGVALGGLAGGLVALFRLPRAQPAKHADAHQN
jgi:hypothetical protein